MELIRSDAYLADDETDMKELEENVRKVEMEGLVWGASKLVPVGFGIKKLQINLVVEDDKVSLEDLQQTLESDEDHVQSTDIVSGTSLIHLILRPGLLTCPTLGCDAKVVIPRLCAVTMQ